MEILPYQGLSNANWSCTSSIWWVRFSSKLQVSTVPSDPWSGHRTRLSSPLIPSVVPIAPLLSSGPWYPWEPPLVIKEYFLMAPMSMSLRLLPPQVYAVCVSRDDVWFHYSVSPLEALSDPICPTSHSLTSQIRRYYFIVCLKLFSNSSNSTVEDALTSMISPTWPLLRHLSVCQLTGLSFLCTKGYIWGGSFVASRSLPSSSLPDTFHGF